MSEARKLVCSVANAAFINGMNEFGNCSDNQLARDDKAQEVAELKLMDYIQSLQEENEKLNEIIKNIIGWREFGCSDDFDRYTAQSFANYIEEALK